MKNVAKWFYMYLLFAIGAFILLGYTPHTWFGFTVYVAWAVTSICLGLAAERLDDIETTVINIEKLEPLILQSLISEETYTQEYEKALPKITELNESINNTIWCTLVVAKTILMLSFMVTLFQIGTENITVTQIHVSSLLNILYGLAAYTSINIQASLIEKKAQE